MSTPLPNLTGRERALPQAVATLTSVADVERITALSDPIVRNLQITQCYYELSLALAARTGSHANWCTFAVWASKQVGQTIRKEDLTRMLEQLWVTVSDVPAHPVSATPSFGTPLEGLANHRRRIREAVLATSSFERASQATARGNRRVFQEIAWEFARFLATVAEDTAFDTDRIAGFCAALRPGDPPDGQRYLVQAFTSYYRAMFEHDPKVRAELLLLGNVAVGLHEQTRLQPEITDALNAPVTDPRELRRRLLEILLPDLGWRLASRIGLHDPVEVALSRLVEQARLLGRVAVTEHITTFGLPGGAHLRLGRDLRAEFPAALAHLVDTELLALLEQVDPTPDSLRDTAVADWSVLPDRMHFIADMFRCFQQQQDLLSPPFSPPQVAALKQGRRPEGRL